MTHAAAWCGLEFPAPEGYPFLFTVSDDGKLSKRQSLHLIRTGTAMKKVLRELVRVE